jgi:hypothetical protein
LSTSAIVVLAYAYALISADCIVAENAQEEINKWMTRSSHPSLLVGGGKPANNVVTSIDGRIFSYPSAIRQARNGGGEIRIAEECNRLPQRCDAFIVTDLLGRRCNDTVQRGTQNVIAPPSKEVPHVHNDCSVLCESLIWMGARARNAEFVTYDGQSWDELASLRILDFQTTDGILEQESDGSVIYNNNSESELRTHEKKQKSEPLWAPARNWPFSSSVLVFIGG